jgi:SAM-dependent methyltransferase
MKTYQPREFWSEVGEEIRRRPNGNEVAGNDTPYYRYKRARFLNDFLDPMPVRGQRVLEVGCGPGGNLRRVARAEPRELVGCDVAPTMVQLARQATRELAAVEVLEINGTVLPFDDRRFDLAFTVTVLMHNPDSMLAKILPEICRVAASRVYLFEDTGPRKRAWHSYFLRPVEEYAAICAAQGFNMVSADTLPVLASETTARAIGAVFPFRDRREGAPKPRSELLLERAALPLTRVVDRAIRPRGGTTRMVFERQ